MGAITLKTATRDTQVSRLEVRAAIASVYSKKDEGQLRGRKADSKTGKFTDTRAAKTGKK
ncbi:MAG: hypothetical protein JWQ30_2724 [Sediminibacterium sp.]|nr:hypothetical protein [Sediminibacterium sp.]